MDIDASTFSVPLRMNSSSSGHSSSNGGQYKKRLLQKYRSEQEQAKQLTDSKDQQSDSNFSSKDQEDIGNSASAVNSVQVSRQPTIEEPPPSPTFAELFHSRDVRVLRRYLQKLKIISESLCVVYFTVHFDSL
jgi:hypothetical protein